MPPPRRGRRRPRRERRLARVEVRRSVNVPGETTRVTSRLTMPLALRGSSTCRRSRRGSPCGRAAPDVRVDRVKRHAAHRNRGAVRVLRARGQRQLEHARRRQRVLVEHLVEVAHAEEHDRVAVLALDVEVLPHGRRGRVVSRGWRGGVVTGEFVGGATREQAEYNIAAMVVLALETVTRAGSLALCADGVVHAQHGRSDAHARRASARRGVSISGRARAGARATSICSPSSPGPDRSPACASASPPSRDWRSPAGRLVVSVPTLEALADGWTRAGRRARPTVVVACLDGQRGEVFFAAWARRRAVPCPASPSLVPPRWDRTAERPRAHRRGARRDCRSS